MAVLVVENDAESVARRIVMVSALGFCLLDSCSVLRRIGTEFCRGYRETIADKEKTKENVTLESSARARFTLRFVSEERKTNMGSQNRKSGLDSR